MVTALAIAAFASTLLGGYVALAFRDKLHLVLGFSAGAVIAIVFFDLLPEALANATAQFGSAELMSFTAGGFFFYLLLDRLIFFRTHGHDHTDATHTHSHKGSLGAAALTLHSFLDGLAIGFAFQVSSAVGFVVAAAVLVHDFSDGVNTVGLVLGHGGERRRARAWLIADALAPVLGAGLTLLFTFPASLFGAVLALFAGFFLYIGASDLIPESNHAHPRFLTTFMTLLGALVLYLAIRLAGV